MVLFKVFQTCFQKLVSEASRNITGILQGLQKYDLAGVLFGAFENVSMFPHFSQQTDFFLV